MMMLKRFLWSCSLVLLCASFAYAQDDNPQKLEFDRWLAQFQQRAVNEGINATIVRDAFSIVTAPSPKIISYDRAQPEFISDYWDYISKRVNAGRIKRGKEMLQTHALLLKRLQDTYGIPPHYLVAFWGLETNFGDYKGKIPIIQALSTLAFDKRRREYFSGELLTFLRLIERENLTPKEAVGSWAGAMGHMQFMPSTYYQYGKDGDGDQDINLWQSVDDAFESAAYYLSQIGWQDASLWGRAVALPDAFPHDVAGFRKIQNLSYWHDLGVTTFYGHALPRRDDISAALYLPLGRHGPAFLLYNNTRIIMKWNNSINYALSVGLLADSISNRDITALYTKPDGHVQINTIDVIATQDALTKRGYKIGKSDGKPGSKTRAALRDFQQKNNLPADGYFDKATLRILLNR